MDKRWTWLAWTMLAVYVVSLVVGLILAVANGEFQQDAANQVLLLLGFSAFMIVGALIVVHRPGNAIGWLFSASALLAFTGAAGRPIWPLRLCNPARVATWGDPCRLVRLLAVVAGHCPDAGVHPVVVPDRSAAVASLAASRLAGRGDHGGLDGAGGPPAQSGDRTGQVIANPIGVAAAGNLVKGPVAPALSILLTWPGGGRVRVAGAAVSAVPG